MSEIIDAVTHEFIGRPGAPAILAIDYFAKASSKDLAKTLWCDRSDAVDTSRAALNRRISFDQLLRYYSLLEVACQQKLIDRLPDGIAKIATRHLSSKVVSVYFERGRQLMLPYLLRQRLTGHPFRPAVDWSEEKRLSIFWTFQDISRILDDRHIKAGQLSGVNALSWLLEDGVTEDGYALDDLIAAFSDEDRIAVALLGANDDGLQPVVRGFYTFLAFANEFEPFLDGQDAISASAYWHVFGYWFGSKRLRLSSTVEHALVQLKASEDRDELQSRVDRLTSRVYAAAIHGAVRPGSPFYDSSDSVGESHVMSTAVTQGARTPITGTIKRLVHDKGFGFIAASDGGEYFFHQSAVQGSGFHDLREGQAVTFSVEKSENAKRPADVRAERIRPE